MSRRELGRQELIDLLADLGRRLTRAGVPVDLYIVGGAAIALTLDARRSTADIDAVYDTSDLVRTLVRAVAEDHDLDETWLNDAAKAWVPPRPDVVDPLDLGLSGVTVRIAPPEHLLAMKMAAYRPFDLDDIEVLFRHLAITTPEEAADIVAAAYGDMLDTVTDGYDDLVLMATAVLHRMRGT